MKGKILFETARLYLTEPSENDYDNLCQMQTNPEVMKFFGGARNIDTIYQKMTFFLSHYKKYNFGYGLVYTKENNKFIGRAGLNKLGFDDNEDRVEIGIILMPDAWRFGYGLEICNGLINFSINILNISEVYFVIDKDNHSSLNIARKTNAIYLGEISYFNEPKMLFIKRIAGLNNN